jgi:hypothetical protein
MSLAWIAKMRATAAAGVDYSPKYGARCPACGQRARIYSTNKWCGPVRVRYHRCDNSGCVLGALGQTIKSVEEDRSC